MKIFCSFLIIMSCFSGPSAIAAEEPTVFEAVRAAQAPVIDGELDDPVWAVAPVITGFTQRDPDEGEPATQRTYVSIAYDDEALYVAARMEDAGPVTSRLGRRDTSIESDSFRIFLDPHLDRRSGYHFGVYASNVQYDAVLFNDTNADREWDAVWSSETTITPNGWNVEMRIPLSQLRFPDRPVHTWGVNAQRYISRLNELARLVHVPTTESGFVSRFARLTGIEGIRPRRTFELLPYAVTRLDRRETISHLDPFTDRTELGAQIGLDLKYGLTSNLTLTGTINPDFGQVEVDPAVVNLTQFETFFPEKRPFFIEGANLFSFGGGVSNHLFVFGKGYADFFYSRRIGREPHAVSPQGFDFVDVPQETTIIGAAKITGKTANGWSIALLDAVTEKETATFQLDGDRFSVTAEPLTNYLVARTAKDISERGRVGMLFTAVNRDLDDSTSFLRREAYTGGLDGYWAFGDRDVILEWNLGGTLVRGDQEALRLTQRSPTHYYQRPDADHLKLDPERTSLDGYTGRVMLAKQTGKWQYNVEARTFSPGFEPNDVGFMSRADVTATHAVLMYFNQDPGPVLRNRRMYVGKFQNWNWDGDLIDNGVSGNWWGQFHNYWSVTVYGGVNGEEIDDRSTRGGPAIKSPLNYWFGFSSSTDARKPISVSASTSGSRDEEGGSAFGADLGVTWRPSNRLSLRVSPVYRRNERFAQYVRTIQDPTATHTYGARYVFAELDQRTVELSTRLDWTFTSRLSLQLYMQPFISAGDYSGFREVARPRSLDYDLYGVDQGTISFEPGSNRYQIDPDAGGPASQFVLGNPDFNFRSLRANAVVRWEFRPGSTLYLVWNENRADIAPVGDLSFGHDLGATFDAPADDVFLVKMSYWLPL